MNEELYEAQEEIEKLKKELDKYCTEEGILRLHSDPTIPGCHFVGGSLGNGIGYAAGLAYTKEKDIFYC